MTNRNSKSIKYFAKTNFRNENKVFGIRIEDMQYHCAVIGKTGSGKTHVLKSFIQNDIDNNRGFCCIDPHGDLIRFVNEKIPTEKKEDVIYLDIPNPEMKFGYNPLKRASYEKLTSYATRLTESRLDFSKDALWNLMHPDFEDLLPGKGTNEGFASNVLINDNTSFDFIDTNQAVEESTRSFIRHGRRPRGVISLSSYPDYLANGVVKLPGKGEIKQEIKLSTDGKIFRKVVRCENPVRTGDDVFAFSLVDLIGRVMKYSSSEGAQLISFRFIFSFDYDSYSFLNSKINFEPDQKQITISPKHLGLDKYSLDEEVIQAHQRFKDLLPSKKRALLNEEIVRRLDLFDKTFARMENDNSWSLAKWAKVQWTVDALDGNAPFLDELNENMTFSNRSFMWLLKELLGVVSNNKKKQIRDAINGSGKLIELLTSVGPKTDFNTISQTVNTVKNGMYENFSLQPWKPSKY